MKSIIIGMLLAIASISFADDRKEVAWEIVPITSVSISDVEVGMGDPDYADDVTLTLKGYLPSSCYQFPIRVERVRSSTDYRIDVYATLRYRPICVEEALFFEKKIQVHNLKEDVLDVVVNPNSDLELSERFIID